MVMEFADQVIQCGAVVARLRVQVHTGPRPPVRGPVWRRAQRDCAARAPHRRRQTARAAALGPCPRNSLRGSTRIQQRLLVLYLSAVPRLCAEQRAEGTDPPLLPLAPCPPQLLFPTLRAVSSAGPVRYACQLCLSAVPPPGRPVQVHAAARPADRGRRALAVPATGPGPGLLPQERCAPLGLAPVTSCHADDPQQGLAAVVRDPRGTVAAGVSCCPWTGSAPCCCARSECPLRSGHGRDCALGCRHGVRRSSSLCPKRRGQQGPQAGERAAHVGLGGAAAAWPARAAAQPARKGRG
jgi:hypothetical protein